MRDRTPPVNCETSRDYYSFNPETPIPLNDRHAQVPPNPYESRNHGLMKERQRVYGPINNRNPQLPPINDIKTRKDIKKQKGSPFDTFGESAIERIYSEFRFLDECSPTTSSQPIFKENKGKRKGRGVCGTMTRLFIFALLPFLQFISSIGLLIFAISRYYELFQEKGISNLLLDLNKPEDYAVTTEEGAHIIRFRTGTAIIVPALLQMISSILGFWGFSQKRRRGMQLGHIMITVLSIVTWMSALTNAAIELNIGFVQLNRLFESTEYFVYVTIACLTYTQVLYLPTVTMSFAIVRLFPIKKLNPGASLGGVVAALGTAVLAALSVSVSAYAASRSLSNIEDWPESTVVNPGAFFAFGLSEAIVGAYVVSASWCTLLCISLNSARLLPVALLLTFTSLLSLLMHVLTPSRLLSIPHAIHVLADIPKPYPVSYVCILLLYGSEVALGMGLMVVLVVISVHSIDSSNPRATIGSPDHSTNCSQL